MWVKYKKHTTRETMPEEIFRHTNLTPEQLMEAVYGGTPFNLRYDAERKVWECDIIKWECDIIRIE